MTKFLAAAAAAVAGTPVAFDELGVSVIVKPVTEAVAERLREMLPKDDDGNINTRDYTAALIAASVYDEDGTPVTDGAACDIRELLTVAQYQRLANEVLRVNGVSAGNG